LGESENPQAQISEFQTGDNGEVESVRLFWESLANAEWLAPESSTNLVDWSEVAFQPTDSEIDFGTLRWLNIPLPEGAEDTVFFRALQADPPPVESGETVYLVSSSGEIRRFSGIAGGSTPLLPNQPGNGESVATIASYGNYQGFTMTPLDGILGVAANGDVHQWDALQDWLDGEDPVVVSTGAYQAGELHGLSYDGNTKGLYVIYEGDNSSQGDGNLGEYASVSDFIDNSNATITASTYGGNITNFFYPAEEAPGNDNTALEGSNYFQIAENGILEGWLTLADYAVNKPTASGREVFQSGYDGTVGGFAVTRPTEVYVVSGTGEIREFSGVNLGPTPLTGNSINDGLLVNTVAEYASYQGFTQIPGGIVYGVAADGSVHEWATLEDWTGGADPVVASSGAFQAGELHGISYNGVTEGVYVIYEGSNSSRGDGNLGEYATVSDFITDSNAVVTPSVYGGNIFNFYYPSEDTAGNDNSALPGANFFQAAGSGVVEGWLTLEDYTVNKPAAGGREFSQSGFANAVGAFARMP
jgi:hypothetical protein